jgi:hypothetical protein
MMKHVLDLGIDTNLFEFMGPLIHGGTALALAAHFSFAEETRFLLQSGADRSIEGLSEVKAASYAYLSKAGEVQEIIC